MADTKISALTSVSSVAGTNEFGVNDSGASRKATANQINTFILSANPFLPSKKIASANYTLSADYSLVIARSLKINSGIIVTVSSGSILRLL